MERNMKIGIDLLAGFRYPDEAITGINRFYRQTKEKIAVGVLWKASGWSTQDAIEFTRSLCTLKSGAVDTIRVNGLWLDNHNFTFKDIDVCVRMARQVRKLAQDHPHIKFYYAPTLEHRMEKTLTESFREAVKKALRDDVVFVNSYIQGGARLKRDLNEQHHTKKGKGNDIFSFDGLDQQDADVYSFFYGHPKATLFMAWSFILNQRYSKDPKKDSTPRKDRKLKPPHWFITALLMQLYHCKNHGRATNLPEKAIYKAYAEAEPVGGFNPKNNNGTLLPRSLKPVYLSPVDSPEIKLYSDDKLICTLAKDRYNEHEKMWVYREKGSKHHPLKLHKLSYNGFARLVDGNGTKYGIQPLFRSGTYRN